VLLQTQVLNFHQPLGILFSKSHQDRILGAEGPPLSHAGSRGKAAGSRGKVAGSRGRGQVVVGGSRQSWKAAGNHGRLQSWPTLPRPSTSPKTRQGSSKNLKRQHSQANQKYHQKAPSVSCGAHSGFKRIAFHYLGIFCTCQGRRRAT
jgi:hypothetical protein